MNQANGEGLIGINGAGGVNFGGDAWRGPKDGMGFVLVFDVTAGKGFVDMAVSLDIVWNTYVG
jgi:hypothetical protein